MKHFTKIKSGAVKSQKPKRCRTCGGEVDNAKDHFMLEAYWKIKRKADKISFCSLGCISKWAGA